MSESQPDRIEHRNKVRNYFDLTAWQRARQLVKRVYEATKTFPAEELYGLRSQLRRASVSVPSNIAEGYGRGTRKDYIHFLQTARGSLYEVETQLILSQDLSYLNAATVTELMAHANSCSQLLGNLIKSLQEQGPDASPERLGARARIPNPETRNPSPEA
jgi:four helix bundle protein